MWHVIFRGFSSSGKSDPVRDLRRLSELCYLWLRPDLHTKEQILDKLVLEQFMISMPPELQVLVKERSVESCKDLEDMLRNNKKPKRWVNRALVMGVGKGGQANVHISIPLRDTCRHLLSCPQTHFPNDLRIMNQFCFTGEETEAGTGWGDGTFYPRESFTNVGACFGCHNLGSFYFIYQFF